MSFKKTGFNNLLEFDPQRGVVRYGAYEMHAKDAGIESNVQTITYDQWLKDLQKANLFGSTRGSKQDFQKYLNGAEYIAPSIANLQGGYRVPAGVFTNIQEDNGNYTVTRYTVPQNIDLVNKIGEAAQSLQNVTRDSDLLKENRANSASRRQGSASTQLLRNPSQVNTASQRLLSA